MYLYYVFQVDDSHHYETMVRNHLEKREEDKRESSTKSQLKPFPESLPENSEIEKRFVFGKGKRTEPKQHESNEEQSKRFGMLKEKSIETKPREIYYDNEMEKRFVYGPGKRTAHRELSDSILKRFVFGRGKRVMDKHLDDEEITKRFVFGKGKRNMNYVKTNEGLDKSSKRNDRRLENKQEGMIMSLKEIYQVILVFS